MTTDPSRPLASPPAQAKVLSLDQFRAEVQDKLGVIFYGKNGFPLHRAIVLKQCEDFLVERYAELLRAADAPRAHPSEKDRRKAQRRSEANTPRSEAGPERRSFVERRQAAFPSSSPLHALLEKLRPLVKEFAAAGICWNSEAGTEVDGEPLRLWSYPEGDPLEQHPWIQGQCWMRKSLSDILARKLDELEATLTAAPQTPEKELTLIKKRAMSLRLEHLLNDDDLTQRSEMIAALKSYELVAALQIENERLRREAQAGPSDPEPTTEAEWDVLTKRLPKRCPESRCIAIGEFQRCTLVTGHSRPHSYESELREARPLPSERPDPYVGIGSAFTGDMPDDVIVPLSEESIRGTREMLKAHVRGSVPPSAPTVRSVHEA